MEQPKKRGRPKKAQVSRKTQQRREQRQRATMSQKQSVNQSVVVKIGDTKAKRKYTPRKKGEGGGGGGGMPPASYQHHLQPTFIQAPQVDYTPLLLALNRTPNPIQPPMATINERTPLSVGVQTTEQELASSSSFQPVPLEMNRRPRSSFVSTSHMDRQLEAEPQQAQVDYGFGNQQFFPRPRSESVVSDLTADSNFTMPSNISELRRKTLTMRGFDTPTLANTPISSQSLRTYERNVAFDDRPQVRQRSISDSMYSPLSAKALKDQLPVQEQPHSSIGSLSSESTESSVSEMTESSVSEMTGSSLSSSRGAEQKPKLGRPVLYSGSSVDSRVKPQYGNALSSSARQEAEIQALKKTFANYEKSNKLDKLKPSEIQDLLIRKGNKSRIDTLAKKQLITSKQYNSYYDRYGYVSKPRGLEKY